MKNTLSHSPKAEKQKDVEGELTGEMQPFQECCCNLTPHCRYSMLDEKILHCCKEEAIFKLQGTSCPLSPPSFRG